MIERPDALRVDDEIRDALDWRDLTPDDMATVDAIGTRRDGINYYVGGIAASNSQRTVPADIVEHGPEAVAML